MRVDRARERRRLGYWVLLKGHMRFVLDDGRPEGDSGRPTVSTGDRDLVDSGGLVAPGSLGGRVPGRLRPPGLHVVLEIDDVGSRVLEHAVLAVRAPDP